MKRLSTIIASLCVAVIGTCVFFACEKESTNDNTLASNSNKIQKEEVIIIPIIEDDTYIVDDYTLVQYETEIGYHWYNPEITDPEPEDCDIIKDPGYRHGSFRWEDNRQIVTCELSGDNCGDAREYDDENHLVASGIWAKDPETQIAYVILYPV